MHDHRSPRLPVAPHGAAGHEAQRVLLLELVIDPPDAGEELGALARRLDLPSTTLAAALGALVAAGLAIASGDRAWPTVAALSFDALLPAGL
jgi:DNA-binding IclR family transcriptional regulator